MCGSDLCDAVVDNGEGAEEVTEVVMWDLIRAQEELEASQCKFNFLIVVSRIVERSRLDEGMRQVAIKCSKQWVH